MLLADSFVRLTHVDAGYDAANVLTARIELFGQQVPQRTARLIDVLLPALRGRPDVVAAGAGSMMPLVSRTAISSFTVPAPDGRPPVRVRAVTYRVTPGFAEALRLRLRDGRFFDDADAHAGMVPMIVNDAFARRYLAEGPAVGRRLQNPYNRTGTIGEIVGVVGNVLKDGNDKAPEPEVYFADGSRTTASNPRLSGFAAVVVRTTGDPAALGADLRSMIHRVDAEAGIDAIEPLTDAVARSVDQPRFATTLLAAFGLLALVLASVGLYGVLSFGVARRRHELGVRAALGAARRDSSAWSCARDCG